MRRLLAVWPVVARSVDLLVAAAESGSEEILSELVAAGAPVNAADESGNTALMLAAHFGHLGVVKKLIDSGADPNAPADNYRHDRHWTSPRHSALYYAVAQGHKDVAELLAPRTDPWLRIQAEVADPHAPSPTDEALDLAAASGDVGAARAALAEGADVRARCGESRRTALLAAASAGHVEVVALLLDAGADIEARDQYGQTALWKAAREGHPLAVRSLILRGADVGARDFDMEQTPLMQAVLANEPEVIAELLSAGADPGATDAEGMSALDFAEYQQLPEARAALQRAIGQGRIEAGATGGSTDVDPEAFMRETIARERFYEAISAGDVGVMRHLLSEWPHLAHADDALLLAAETGQADAAAALLEAGAPAGSDRDPRDNPLHVAAGLGHLPIVKMILAAGGRRSLDEALRRAALGAHESTAQWLLDVGAAIDARDDSGRTALWNACSRQGCEAVVRLLLARGADVDVRDSVYGLPPLFMAIRSGSLGSVVALLGAGADPRTPDARTGVSPLDYAVHKKLPEIQAVLRRAIDGHGPGPASA